MRRTKIRILRNSKGIFIPKAMVDESGIKGTAQITVKKKIILITSAREKEKKTWDNFKRVKRESADFAENRFDIAEW